MTYVHVTATRFVDPSQPGWVECALVDVEGVTHVFVEKVPVVTTEDLDASSDYPRPARFACEIVERQVRDDGRSVVTIDTERPWVIESTAGLTRFVVFEEQLT